ncbi:MAG: class I adenylate-forming enzyme family protein [Thermoanaerobaculia bacterium]
MLVDLKVGSLHEPLSGRRWDPPEITRRWLERAALYRDLGLAPSDCVFLHLGNTPEFFVELLAIWALGGCVAPIDPRLTPFEVQTLAAAARPRFSVWPGAPVEEVAEPLAASGARLVDVSEPSRGQNAAGDPVPPETPGGLDADALILFTSGTTGQPKGVVHTHRSLRARWIGLRQSLGVEKFRRTLCLLPTHFGHGLICNCLFPWLSGQDLFIAPPFRSDLVIELGGLLDRCGITFLSSVPSLWRLALRTARPPRRGTLERVFCGSAPLSASLWREIQQWAGTREVWNAYGITETGSWLAGSSIEDLVVEDGLIGPAWGSVVRVLRSGTVELPPGLAEQCAAGEPGYVWVNTAALMRGYLGRDDLTRRVVRDGWFSTGDIGLLDARGFLYLRGRVREEINKGGMKVYPGDIDAVVERFEGASDVCAFGFEDALYGEDVGIAVVLEAREPAVLRRLLEWTRRHLARHQMPRRWYLLDEIPRSSRGKVNRSAVAEHCAQLAPLDLRELAGDERGGADS